MFVTEVEEGLDLCGRAGLHDRPRNQPVETRIRGVGDHRRDLARVVGQDPPHHARVDRRRIRSDLSVVRLEGVVDVAADHPGLDADLVAAVLHVDLAPVPGHLDQDPVGDRLAGEARAGGTEGERNVVFVTEVEEGLDLCGRAGLHDRPRNQPVETRIRGVGDPIDRPAEDPLPVDDAGKKVRKDNRGQVLNRKLLIFLFVYQCP